MGLKLEIATTLTVKAYLSRKYGGMVIALKDRDPLAQFIAGQLQTKKYSRYSLSDIRSDHKVVILMSDWMRRNRGGVLHATGESNFNSYMQELIRQEIIFKIDTYKAAGMKQRDAILLVQDEMGFCEDTYKIETIDRYYRRHRTARILKKMSEKSPSINRG